MNQYQRAANLWAARNFNLPIKSIERVDFAVERGGGCETCAYEDAGIEVTFKRDANISRPYGRFEVFSLSISPGQFIEECVALLPEVEEADASSENEPVGEAA